MEEEEEEEEKIPLCESIGHRPLRGRCPKGGKPASDERKSEGANARLKASCHESLMRIKRFLIS